MTTVAQQCMTARERVLRAVEFREPDAPPIHIDFSMSTWYKYGESLLPYAMRILELDDYRAKTQCDEEYSTAFKRSGEFGEFRAGELVTDDWGCVWRTAADGMEGQVVVHPLADWSKLDEYQLPDPIKLTGMGPWDWEEVRTSIEKGGHNHWVTLPGDRFWERVLYLRGFENAMIDMVEGSRELVKLIDLIMEHHMRLIEHELSFDTDAIHFGDDAADQRSLMVSPDLWRNYFKPAYKQMFQFIVSHGRKVQFHSDGNVLAIIDDIIECGASILQLQYRPNGIENLASICKGRACLAMDIDRQWILPFGTPDDVKTHIHEIVSTLDNGSGGVIVWGDIFPDTPLENIEALVEACEEVRGVCA